MDAQEPYRAYDDPIVTPYASLADLTRDRVTSNEEDYMIEGVGMVRIRALSRAAFMEANKRYGEDMMAQERFVLSRSIVQPAGVTESVVGEWQKSSPINEINKLAQRINAMSGIGTGADKSDVD